MKRGGNSKSTLANEVIIYSDLSAPPKLKSNDEENELIQLREENSRLQAVIQNMSRDGDGSQVKSPQPSNQVPCYGELKLELIQTKQELSRAKGALQGEAGIYD